MSDENINCATASNYSITSGLSSYDNKIKVKFNGSCSKPDKITYTHGTIEILTLFMISKIFNIISYPALENCLFGAVSLTENVDIDEYKYFEYGDGFDRKGKLTVSNRLGRSCLIFAVDMSFSVHVDNKKKGILVVGERPIPGLDGTTLTAEKKYSIDVTKNTLREQIFAGTNFRCWIGQNGQVSRNLFSR